MNLPITDIQVIEGVPGGNKSGTVGDDMEFNLPPNMK
jgi:hypothetical protein